MIVTGRRGSSQAAFTIKELRELTKIDNVLCTVSREDMELSANEASLAELSTQRPKKRIDDLLREFLLYQQAFWYGDLITIFHQSEFREDLSRSSEFNHFIRANGRAQVSSGA